LRKLLLFALATLCAAGASRAQEENVATAEALLAVMDRKQAAERLLEQIRPEYPPIAKVNYIQGQVNLELTVDSKGKVSRAHVLAGNALLAAAALKAVRRWLYRPLSTPSGPGGFSTTVKIKFNLAYVKADLAPPQAERDFLRQVKPPQAVRPPDETPSEEVVHLRLLVDDQGHVDDIEASPREGQRFDAAREILQGWTFRPAQWGSLPVASYLDVAVPVSAPPMRRAAARIEGTAAICQR